MKRIAFIFALCCLLQNAAYAETIILDETQRAAFGIRTQSVMPGGIAFSKPYPSKVTVPNTQLRVISAPLEGIIEALMVAEGEAVERGQPIASMHSPGLLNLQASYLESVTRRKLAQELYTRDRNLHSEGIIAKRRLLESQAKYDEMRTAESRDRQALVLAGMSGEAIDHLELTQKLSNSLEVSSPLGGVVLEQIATAGQRLDVAAPLYKIGDLSKLWVEVHVPLDVADGIQPGSRIVVPGNIIGKVITVGRMVHGSDQGVLVRAEIDQGANRLRPGQFVEVRLGEQTQSDAIRMPSRAVIRSGSREIVFVERNGQFVVVPVSIINREPEIVVARGALSAGEPVVVEGTVLLKATLSGDE